MKWNAYHISEVLQVYEKYPTLWDPREKDYSNKQLRDEALRALMDELDQRQLLGGMDLKQMKTKLKTIKDVYRMELHKIAKSIDSGCASEDVYKPKLAWFSDAAYLHDIVASRSSTSNLDMFYNIEILRPHEDESGASSIDKNNYSVEISAQPSVRRRPLRPLGPALKRFKKPVVRSELSEAIQLLEKMTKSEAAEKPFDTFGKHVAAELRQLPQRAAVLLQQEIQNAITHARLSSMDNHSNVSKEENSVQIVHTEDSENDAQ